MGMLILFHLLSIFSTSKEEQKQDIEDILTKLVCQSELSGVTFRFHLDKEKKTNYYLNVEDMNKIQNSFFNTDPQEPQGKQLLNELIETTKKFSEDLLNYVQYDLFNKYHSFYEETDKDLEEADLLNLTRTASFKNGIQANDFNVISEYLYQNFWNKNENEAEFIAEFLNSESEELRFKITNRQSFIQHLFNSSQVYSNELSELYKATVSQLAEKTQQTTGHLAHIISDKGFDFESHRDEILSQLQQAQTFSEQIQQVELDNLFTEKNTQEHFISELTKKIQTKPTLRKFKILKNGQKKEGNKVFNIDSPKSGKSEKKTARTFNVGRKTSFLNKTDGQEKE